ncbi:MAG TPA: DUF3352 domain-containing protein, partial [Acidothermaceae bacterium]
LLPGNSGGDMLASGPGDMLASGSVERPRRNLAAILVSLLAVLAVIGGGVAYVGYHKLASSGAQPDQWAPASSIAYLKIDLDPAASEKIAALRFEQKFPDAPHVTSADQLKDALLSEAFNRPSSEIDYATDIKPWLGDRVAIAVYPDSAGAPQPVGILQVKDATKAQAGLAKLIHTPSVSGSGTPGFDIEGDYAIVGPSQAAVDAAVAAARTSSITASNQYAGDVATLGGDRIVTAWADLGALAKYASKSGALTGGLGSSALGDLSGLGGGSGLGSLGSLAQLGGAQGLTTSALKGRLVLGLELQAGYASISGRLIGADVSGVQNGDAGTLLGQLPAGSVAGVAASGIGALISKELTTLESGPLAALGVKGEMDALGARLGISLPGDAINLLGNDVAVGLDSVPAAHGKGKFTAIAEPTDVTQGLKTAQALAGLMTASGTPATATASGSKVSLTNDGAASGALGNDSGFKAAMSGMPDQVVAAAYVNLAGIWPTVGSKVPSDIRHLTGIGTYEALAGSDITFTVRVTVN